eukprot:8807715-Karenia_brevis.AAC.1
MTHVDCQWLTWIESIEKHVGEPLQTSWASQENEGELLGSFQGMIFKGPQTCFGCQWLRWIDNDSRGQWLTWIESIEKHVWEPLQSCWASQESEGELLGCFQGMIFKGPQTCFACQWLRWIDNDSRGLPMAH